ncbi:MAG: histidinol-phosphatase [Treponema sp.]|nr:histidinol-phosphatase [Treponema sp.]
MRYSCLHTHSVFCDGEDSVEVLCEQAAKRGFVSIGFSSHGPLYQRTGLSSDWHIDEARLGAYIEAVLAARRRWEGKLRVFLGLEADYISGLMGPGDREFQSLGLDYIIGSVHYVVPPKGRPFTVDGPAEELERNIRDCFDGDGWAAVEAYWDAVEAMIRAGGFDILGHADLIKKNNRNNRWFDPRDPRYQARLRRAAELTAASGLTAEVNTGGINRGAIGETYPAPAFLEALAVHQAPVTITADAHRAAHLGGGYPQARQTLLAAGYTHAALFEGRERGRPVWTEDPL